LEGEEGNVGGHQKEAQQKQKGEWAKDEDRKPRSKEEMNQEAQWLRDEMARDEEGGGPS
jgi:bis(5'-adenosyl)-triphosphatase